MPRKKDKKKRPPVAKTARRKQVSWRLDHLIKLKEMRLFDWLKLMEKGSIAFFIMLFAVSFLEGNGFYALLWLMGLLFIFIFFEIFEYLVTGNKEKLNTVFIGAGILMFAIVTYLIASPVFVFDGTDSCEMSATLSKVEDQNILILNDLNARYTGDRLATIQIKTLVIPGSNAEIECGGCDTGRMVKPDNNQDTKLSKTLIAAPRIKFSGNIEDILFVQQTYQTDTIVPLISEQYRVVRICECNIDHEKNEVACSESNINCTFGVCMGTFKGESFFTLGWGTSFSP